VVLCNYLNRRTSLKIGQIEGLRMAQSVGTPLTPLVLLLKNAREIVKGKRGDAQGGEK